MPRRLLPLAETHLSITRPVCLAVIQGLSEVMGLPKIPSIQFLGRSEHALQKNSTVTNPAVNQQQDQANFRASEKFFVTATEIADENTLLTTQTVRSNDAPPLFFDTALGIVLKPVRRSTEVTLSFNYRTSNLKEAEALKQTLLAQISQHYTEQIHSAEYTFPLPTEFLADLYKLWQVRESQGGYGDTFKDYYDANRTDRLTIITNMAGQKPYVAVPEIAENIHGWFDFSDVPQEDRADVPGTWMVTFDYKFKYDKPVQVAFQYPLVIHNQFIPEELIGETTETSYGLMEGDRNYGTHRMDWFRSLDKFFHTAYPGVRIPHYDDWWSTAWPFATYPLVTALIGVDPAHPRIVNSIVDFEEYLLDDVFIPYFTKYRTKLLNPYFSPLQFSVYSEDDLLSTDTYTVNPDLVIETVADMSIRRTYHVRVSLLMDLSLLSAEGKKALLLCPAVCLLILATLDPNKKLPSVVADTKVVESEFNDFIATLPKTFKPSASTGRLPQTVGYGTIVARKR